MPGDLLTTREAGELLGVSRWTISRWIGEGRLPAIRLPTGRLRIRREDVEKLLRQGAEDIRLDRPPGAGPGAMAATCPICTGPLQPQKGGDPRARGWCAACSRFVV